VSASIAPSTYSAMPTSWPYALARAVPAGAGHLHELQPSRRRAHLAGERHRHQHVHVAELAHDAGLIGDDDLAREAEVGPHGGLEAGGKGSGEGDGKHGGSSPA